MNNVTRLSAAAGLVLLGSCAAPQTRPPDVLIQEFRGEVKEPWRGDASLADAYARVIDALMPGLSDENELIRQPAEQTLEDLCVRAGRPGAERNRRAVCKVMSARLGPETAWPARMWFLRQLARIGKKESVDPLAALLTDDNHLVRDAARRALESNPDRRAGDALADELMYALNAADRRSPAGDAGESLPHIDDPEWASSLIHALARRGRASEFFVLAMVLALKEGHPDVGAAALAALGRTGAIRLLDHLFDRPEHRQRMQDLGLLDAWTAAELSCAEARLAAKKKSEAADIYVRLLRRVEDPRRKAAALAGCARAEGARALPRLLHYMGDADPRLRIAAAAMACELPRSQDVTRQLADRRASFPPDVQARLIEGLADRGDPAARVAVLGCLHHPSAEVRVAAARAMARVGEAAHIRLLARIAAERTGEEQKAARASLAELRAPGFDRSAIFALQTSTAAIQAEVWRALKSRQSPVALAWTLEWLPGLDAAAQGAALDYLAAVAPESSLPDLCRMLPMLIDDDGVASAAEDAMVSVSLRCPTPPRSTTVLSALASADAATRPALLRILGRIGEPEGLDAIRYHLASEDAPARDAAVRALCAWKDASALSDVESLMRNASDPAHRQLAFRAFVRMTKPADANPTSRDMLARYDEALTLARSPEEKKLVLSGFSELACPEALDRLELVLADESLRAEATAALCAVTKALCGLAPDRARAALERARGYPHSDAVQRAVEEALEHLDRYRGYIVSWKFAGPFSLTGKDANDLFDLPLGPEPGAAASAVEWRDLPVTDPKNPWLFDLTPLSSASHQVVYVRAALTSPTSTPARLEIGSDDGVKVWLNGERVHANKVFRPLEATSDIVPISLRPGVNDLLVKVVQGSGGWGVCCGVKTSDGGNLDGLVITAP